MLDLNLRRSWAGRGEPGRDQCTAQGATIRKLAISAASGLCGPSDWLRSEAGDGRDRLLWARLVAPQLPKAPKPPEPTDPDTLTYWEPLEFPKPSAKLPEARFDGSLVYFEPRRGGPLGERCYITHWTLDGPEYLCNVSPARQPRVRRYYLYRLLEPDAEWLARYKDNVAFLATLREAKKRREGYEDEAEKLTYRVRCVKADGTVLEHTHRTPAAAFKCKAGAYWIIQDANTYNGRRRVAKRADGPPEFGPVAISQADLGVLPDSSPTPEYQKITLARGKTSRPPVGQTMKDIHACKAAANMPLPTGAPKASTLQFLGARIVPFTVKTTDGETVTLYAAENVESVRYGTLALQTLDVLEARREWAAKLTELPTYSYYRGERSRSGNVALQLKPDGTPLYALPTNTCADKSWGETDREVIRARQKMAGGPRGRDQAGSVEDPTADAVISDWTDEERNVLGDVRMALDVPEIELEETIPDEAEIEAYDEEDPDEPDSGLNLCRMAWEAIQAGDVLTERQHQAFRLAYAHGLGNGEIAARMGISADRAGRLVLEARHKVEAANGQPIPNRDRGKGSGKAA